MSIPDGCDQAVGEPDVSQPLVIRHCCRCSQTIAQDAETFDSENCAHSFCVRCRFQDELECLFCNTNKSSDTDISKKEITESLPLYTSMLPFLKKKKHNTDHIVDVEYSPENGSVFKQMCTICKRIFKKSNARYHYACATGDKPYVCNECGQKFVKKSHLNTHLNSHYGIKPFKCTERKCKASFTQKDKLIRHLKTHCKDMKHSCPVCDKQYSSLPILNFHLEKVHSSLKPFKCDVCPRAYKYKRSLRVHKLKHQAKREHMCEVCGKVYPVAGQLKAHRRSHLKLHRRPHKCACGKRFMTRRDRTRHEITHVASNDFECSVCNTTFGRKDNLERHMKTFHEVKLKIKPTATVAPYSKTSGDVVSKNKRQDKDISENDPTIKQKTDLISKVNNKTKTNKAKLTKQPKKSKMVEEKKETGSNEIKKSTSEIEIPNHETPCHTPSVIVSPQKTENQNRPSVIKNIPKLLPYRVLPPDKRFLKMTENIANGEMHLNLMPPPTSGTKFKSTQHSLHNNIKQSKANFTNQNDTYNNTQKKKSTPNSAPKKMLPKDDPLNRCFRIICHTSAVKGRQQSSVINGHNNVDTLENDIIKVLNKPSKSSIHPNTAKSPKSTSNSSLPSCSSVSSRVNKGQLNVCSTAVTHSNRITTRIDEDSNSTSTNAIGGPSLPSVQVNPSTATQEDSFTASYSTLGESSYSSYTPYFESDCFRENVNCYDESNVEHLLPNDLDMGFQYLNEQLGCSEMGLFGEPRVVRYVTQEGCRAVRESFNQSF